MNLEEIQRKGKKILVQFAIPCIIAMLLTSAITLVDGYFIGNYVGKEGTAAVNLGLPLLYFYLGIGIMIGVGGIAQAGILYGAGDREKCQQIFRQSVVLSIIITFGLTALLAIVFYPVTEMLGVDKVTLKCFRSYYFIIIFQFPLLVLNNNLGMFMRGEGKPQINMLISILSLVINTILDYISVEFFNMGICGIALSSLITAIICVLCSVLFFLKFSQVYHFGPVKMVKDDIKKILLNGSSEMIGQLSMCITMAAYNVVILKIAGVSGVAAFAIVGFMAYFFQMFVVGIGQGMSPLVSFVYGAGDIKTAKMLLKSATFYSILAGIVAFVALFIGKNGYSHLFLQDKSVVSLISSGIIIFALSFILEGFNTMASFYFTSIGFAKESAIISGARGLVVLLIALAILPSILGMLGIWLVAPVTEMITVLICLYYYGKKKDEISIN